MSVAVEELVVADPPEGWRAAGFRVDDDVCRIGSVGLRLAGRDAGRGVVGWALSGLATDVADVDGIATSIGSETASPTDSARSTNARTPHPNGVVGIDHVVVLTPDVTRTVTALGALGLEARRERTGDLAGEPVRQVFYRLGEVILEVVGPPETTGDWPARIWGITFTVADLDAAADHLGDGLGRVKAAVQPGRRIATLRTKGYDISTKVALISPDARR